MKYFVFSSSFSKTVIFLILSFVLAASADYTQENFLQCLSTSISNSTSNFQTIVYTQNDPSYSTVLKSSIQNPRFYSPSTSKPFAVVTPFNVSDTQSIVYCAKKHGFQIRIRSGGHDYEGISYHASNSNVQFLVLDLVNIRSISINVKRQTAWVQTGATLGELYYRLIEKNENLGFPAGICYTVGVGGHLSGGGYGFLMRKYGLAADNIIDAQFLDAQGRILDRKSMGEDLFWSIRGGGAASFGIVLAWKLRLVPVPSDVTVFDVKRSMEDDATKKLIHRWQRSADKVDVDLSIFLEFSTVSSIDKEGNKKIGIQASFLATFHGDGGVDKLLQLMQKEFPELGLQRQECTEMSWLQSFLYFNRMRNGQPLETLLDRTPYSNFFAFKVKSDFVNEPIPDDALEGMLEMLYEEEVGRGAIDLFPYGGIMSKISEFEIPFPHRAGNLYMVRYAVLWEKEENMTAVEKHLSWINRLYNYMTPYMSKNPRAAYLNFRDLDIGINNYEENTTSTCNNFAQARIWGTMYFKNNLYRLLYVKTIVDPTNFFTNEQSIPPLPTH